MLKPVDNNVVTSRILAKEDTTKATFSVAHKIIIGILLGAGVGALGYHFGPESLRLFVTGHLKEDQMPDDNVKEIEVFNTHTEVEHNIPIIEEGATGLQQQKPDNDTNNIFPVGSENWHPVQMTSQHPSAFQSYFSHTLVDSLKAQGPSPDKPISRANSYDHSAENSIILDDEELPASVYDKTLYCNTARTIQQDMNKATQTAYAIHISDEQTKWKTRQVDPILLASQDMQSNYSPDFNVDTVLPLAPAAYTILQSSDPISNITINTGPFMNLSAYEINKMPVEEVQTHLSNIRKTLAPFNNIVLKIKAADTAAMSPQVALCTELRKMNTYLHLGAMSKADMTELMKMNTDLHLESMSEGDVDVDSDLDID